MKAKRKSQATGYAELLERHGLNFEQLRVIAASGMPVNMGATALATHAGGSFNHLGRYALRLAKRILHYCPHTS